jgi:hypothetical protein
MIINLLLNLLVVFVGLALVMTGAAGVFYGWDHNKPWDVVFGAFIALGGGILTVLLSRY